MGKRKREDPEYIKKKIRKLEKKLLQASRESPSPPSTPPAVTPATSRRSPTPPVPDLVTETNKEDEMDPDTELEPTAAEDTEEQLPEELLQALGHEGVDKDETGDPIRNELALRWSKIMAEGLKKEQKEALLSKYMQPKNFQAAVAPILNKEIAATLSELSLNRDKRIVARQNTIGKLMSCLGKSLTDILKGNINSKKLVEEINDAAKIAAEMYHTDLNSRKFFALSSSTKAVQDTCKETKPTKFLFGDNLNDQIKSLQTVKRTANQIQTQENRKPSTTTQHLNWRSPLQYQTSQRGRGGQHPTRHRPATNQPSRRPPPTRGAPRHAPRRANYRRF